MKYAVLGILSLIVSALCSLYIFMSASGLGGSGPDFYAPVEVRTAGIGLIIGVLMSIFFFYKHYRGHPEMHLFDQDAT